MVIFEKDLYSVDATDCDDQEAKINIKKATVVTPTTTKKHEQICCLSINHDPEEMVNLITIDKYELETITDMLKVARNSKIRYPAGYFLRLGPSLKSYQWLELRCVNTLQIYHYTDDPRKPGERFTRFEFQSSQYTYGGKPITFSVTKYGYEQLLSVLSTIFIEMQ